MPRGMGINAMTHDIATAALEKADSLSAAVNGVSPDGARDASDTPRRPVGIVTAAALARATFPEPRWAVPSVLPEGATLLVGAPKKGKSWLLLGLGIAIAQ